MKKLICKSVCKFSEEDRFEDGCIMGRFEHKIKFEIIAATLEDIKIEIADLTGCDKNDIIVNPYYLEDEVNRVEVVVYEDKTGQAANNHQMNKWKEGDLRLWLCTYTFYFELIGDIPNLLEY